MEHPETDLLRNQDSDSCSDKLIFSLRFAVSEEWEIEVLIQNMHSNRNINRKY